MRRNMVRIISTVAASGLVAAMLATGAIADLNGCNNCIEAQDIADGAVRAAELSDNLRNTLNANDIATGGVGKLELAANSVGFSELRDGAVGIDELRIDSVGLSELLDSVTPAAGIIAVTGTLSTTGDGTAAEELEQFNVTVPGDGYLLVQLGARMSLGNEAASTAADTDTAQVGLCDATADFTGCGQDTDDIRATDPDDDDVPTATDLIYLARVVAVTAGTKTLYLNAQASTTADNAPAALSFDSVQLSALFVPATLSITTGA